MARAILSFGMLSARAARIAARRRGFMSGSGRPILADTVISRASLPNTFDLMASCRPLRCMMFLNWEWPANGASSEFVSAEFFARLIGPRGGEIHSHLILRSRAKHGVSKDGDTLRATLRGSLRSHLRVRS